jgi:uncharacterized protein YecE (DUF72 family)
MAKIMEGRIHLGTSGWHYKGWVGLFYPAKIPAKKMLNFYAQHFDTVEINNSFYHLPLPSTYDSWHHNSPGNFLFAVKGSRFITHMKKLKDPRTSSKKFFDGVERLGEKLGPILFQLPPNWHVNLERLTTFLEALPKGHRYVFEFRDESWLMPEVYELLSKYKAAFCIHDLARMQTRLKITADFSYIRFHGPGEAKYAGSYSTQALEKWAQRIMDWRRREVDVYAYFNNDVGGHAVENSKKLKELME